MLEHLCLESVSDSSRENQRHSTPKNLEYFIFSQHVYNTEIYNKN